MRDEAGKQLRSSMPGNLQAALRISEIINRAVEMENKEKNKNKIFSLRTKTKKCFNCGKMGHMKLVCSFPPW
jgi:hypothetical protein